MFGFFSPFCVFFFGLVWSIFRGVLYCNSVFLCCSFFSMLLVFFGWVRIGCSVGVICLLCVLFSFCRGFEFLFFFLLVLFLFGFWVLWGIVFILVLRYCSLFMGIVVLLFVVSVVWSVWHVGFFWLFCCRVVAVLVFWF